MIEFRQKNFNSTMVRLKASRCAEIRSRKAYFNSTMVRLKENLCRCRKETRISFQFHYGTIKSQVHGFSQSECDISIPLWYD